MNWRSLAELLAIHARVIEATGGVHGVINAGALASALWRPFTSSGGQAACPGWKDKVAALFHSVVAFHPFVDGNQRTSLVAAGGVLRLNAVRIRPGDEVEAFFWSIARGEQTVEQMAQWPAHHVEPACLEGSDP